MELKKINVRQPLIITLNRLRKKLYVGTKRKNELLIIQKNIWMLVYN